MGHHKNSNRHVKTTYTAIAMAVFSLSAQAQDDTSLPSIPDYFQQKGITAGQSYDSTSVNEVVDNFSGKLQYHSKDIAIPGNGGMDLVIQRVYNSIDDPLATPTFWNKHEYSPVGLGWTMHMGRVIRGTNKGICSNSWASASANPVLELPDGNRQILYETASAGTQVWMSKDFFRATCPAGPYLHVQSPDGTTYEMTEIGNMFGEPNSMQTAYYAGRVIDRNGNWFKLSYQFLPNGTYAMKQITTSDGRVIDFAYDNSVLKTITDVSTNRVWEYKVVSGDGGHVYLSEVKRPDNLSWKYTYHNSTPGTGSLKRVEYPSGATIDYSYGHVDFRAGTPRSAPSTVLMSKVANANTAGVSPATWKWAYKVATDELPWTLNGNEYTYSFSIPPAVRSQVNVTTVTDPMGKNTEHFSLGVHSVRIAASHVGRNIGSLSDEEGQLFSHENIAISSQRDVVADFFTPQEHWPIATTVRRHHIYRSGESFDTVKSGFDDHLNPATIVETGTNNSDRTYQRTTSLTYDKNLPKWLLRQVATSTVTVDGETHNSAQQFDANGNVKLQTSAGVTTAFTYDPQGNRASSTNAKGQQTTFTNYHRGVARTETQPEGVVLSRGVDDAGNITSQTNGNGHTTTFTYDGLNRLTGATPPIGNPTTVSWTPTTRKVQRGSMTDLMTYDGLGRTKRREVSAPGETSVWVNFNNDGLGRRIFQSYPNSAKGIGFRYDTIGRVTRTLHNNTPGTETADLLETTVSSSLRILKYDSTNRASSMYYRAFGNPDERQTVRTIAGEWDGSGMYTAQDVTMTRDVLGQLKTATMDGKTRSYGYDSRFFLTSRTDPETGTTTFGRDAIGNMSSQQIVGQPATTFGYDGRNRLTTTTYPPSEQASTQNAPSVVHTYDFNDQVKTVTSGTVVQTFDYDEVDKLKQETLTVDGGATQTVGYGYDANDALDTLTYPSGHMVSYQPDAFGRPRAVLPHVVSVNYHPNGMPSDMKYANGVISTLSLNPRQWPGRLTFKRPNNGGSFINSAFSYDLVGNLTTIMDTTYSTLPRIYKYDYVDRLVYDADSADLREYFYDNSGNLKFMGKYYAGDIGYGYDTAGRLAVVGGSTQRNYQYDSAGNVSEDGFYSFGHDRANNMRCINCTAATPMLHTYDGSNMRVKSVFGPDSRQYLHNHQGLLLQTVNPGVEFTENIYLGRRQVASRRVVN